MILSYLLIAGSVLLSILILSKIFYKIPKGVEIPAYTFWIWNLKISLVKRLFFTGLIVWLIFGFRFLLSCDLKDISYSIFGTLYFLASLLFSKISIQKKIKNTRI